MLKRIGEFVHTVYEKAKFAKDVTATGDFMLRAYGAANLMLHDAPHIVGLLTG
jgi:hypothetical protein